MTAASATHRCQPRSEASAAPQVHASAAPALALPSAVAAAAVAAAAAAVAAAAAAQAPSARTVYGGGVGGPSAGVHERGRRVAATAAVTAAAAGMKCRQIATGAVYEDPVDPLTGAPRTGTRKWFAIHNHKLDALQDLMEELQGQQLFTGYYFGHDLVRMRTVLGEDVPYIAGGVSDKKALAYQDSWNKREIECLVAHPSSVGHGLNFQKGGAHHIFFYSLTYDYEEYDQFTRRLMRQGNPAAQMFIHIPMAKDTIEEAIWSNLTGKRRTQDALHLALEEYRERRKPFLR